MKQITILFTILLLTTLSIKAQHTITGIIKDSEGNPLIDAKVEVKNTEILTITDKSGSFSIEVPQGSNILIIKSARYSQKEIMVEDDTKEVNTELDPLDIFEMSLEDLMSIEVVSAGKVSQKINEAPAIISVITKQQIKESGYKTVSEALQSVPGLDILNDYLHSNAGVRGVNGGLRAWSRIMKVMINNQPVSFRSSTENWFDEELIPINVVQRIEIVRGPSSALYGANAFLGVINIITITGEDINGGMVTVNPGMFNENPFYGGDIILGKKYNNLDFLLSVSGANIDRSSVGVQNMPGNSLYSADSLSVNDISKPASLYSKISYKTAQLGTIALDFNYQHVDKYGEFQDYGVLTHKNHIKMRNFFARGSLNKVFNEHFLINTSISAAGGSPYNDEKLAINYAGYADYMTRNVGYKSIDFTGEARYSYLEKNNITIGVDYTVDEQELQSYNRVNNGVSTPMGIELGNKEFTNLGIFIQPIIYPADIFNINKLQSLGITLGLRYDKNNIYGDVINYRAAIVYQISKPLYVKAMYGTSYKALAANQLYTTLLKPGTDIIGNPDLKPEKAKTKEIEFGGNFNNGLGFAINVFNNIVDGKVEIVKDPSQGSNLVAKNMDKITTYGSEFTLSFTQKYITAYTNFSYQQSKYKSAESIISNNLVEFDSKLYPSMMSKTGITYRFPKYHFAINTEGRWIDNRLSSLTNTLNTSSFYFIPYKISNYFTIDFCISTIDLKLFKKHETIISLKVSNILNEKFYYPGFKDFDIQGEPRIISLKISQTF